MEGRWFSERRMADGNRSGSFRSSLVKVASRAIRTVTRDSVPIRRGFKTSCHPIRVPLRLQPRRVLLPAVKILQFYRSSLACACYCNCNDCTHLIPYFLLIWIKCCIDSNLMWVTTPQSIKRILQSYDINKPMSQLFSNQGVNEHFKNSDVTNDWAHRNKESLRCDVIRKRAVYLLSQQHLIFSLLSASLYTHWRWSKAII